MNERIAESELIINARGAIYHLDTKPEEIAENIITVGDPHRVKEVSKYFDEILFKNEHREFVTHTGMYKGKKFSCVSTGIGPDNVDIVFNELDALVNIDFETRKIKDKLTSLKIVRIGTCGSLQADIPADSFVVTTYGLGIDNLILFYQHKQTDDENLIVQAFLNHTQLLSTLSIPYLNSAAPSLLKLFVGNNFHHGITVTCPGFYGPQGRILRLPIAMPNFINQLTSFSYGNHRIANFEMETAAIYGLGKLLHHQCLSLSLVVANRVSQTFSNNATEKMEQLIQTTLDRLV